MRRGPPCDPCFNSPTVWSRRLRLFSRLTLAILAVALARAHGSIHRPTLASVGGSRSPWLWPPCCCFPPPARQFGEAAREAFVAPSAGCSFAASDAAAIPAYLAVEAMRPFPVLAQRIRRISTIHPIFPAAGAAPAGAPRLYAADPAGSN